MKTRARGLPAPLPEAMLYMAENTVRLLLAAAIGVAVARHLGPESLGLLSYATSVFAVLLPVAALGMRSILVREFSVSGNWRPILASSLTQQLRAAVAASAAAAFIVMASRGFQRDAVQLAFALFPLPILALGDTIRALLEAQHNARRIVLSGFIAALAASAMKLAAVWLDLPIWVFGLAVTTEAGVLALVLVWGRVGRRPFLALRAHHSKSLAKGIVKESWPLLVAAIAVTLYMRVDVMMLGLIASDTDTGMYAVAVRLSEVWYFIPVAAAAAVRPRLAAVFAAKETQRYLSMTQRFMSSAFLASAVAALVTLLMADSLISFLYGAEFAAAADVLRIHILAAPFVFLGVASSQWFIDHGLTRAVMLRTSIGAVTNIALNLLLIPRFGPSGAAFSTLISYALAAMLINAIFRTSRPLFAMQMRAFRLSWPSS